MILYSMKRFLYYNSALVWSLTNGNSDLQGKNAPVRQGFAAPQPFVSPSSLRTMIPPASRSLHLQTPYIPVQMPMMAYVKREAPELDSAAPRKRFKPAAEVEDTHVTELHELILQEGLLLSECSNIPILILLQQYEGCSWWLCLCTLLKLRYSWRSSGTIAVLTSK